MEGLVQPENKMESQKIEWELVIHLSLDKSFARKDSALVHGVKVYKEIHTKRDEAGFPKGKPKTIYYMEGDERNFKTPDELIKAVLKKILKK